MILQLPTRKIKNKRKERKEKKNPRKKKPRKYFVIKQVQYRTQNLSPSNV